jgi:coenzyme F420-dependent glucose-6-phosphate dehydrogenase
MVQLGWKAGPEQFPPTELLDYAISAEKAGFDSLDVSDHFNPWSEEGQACFSWTWLGAAATHLSRMHMGTGITCPILRYHPTIIAQAAATVSCFAPGERISELVRARLSMSMPRQACGRNTKNARSD